MTYPSTHQGGRPTTNTNIPTKLKYDRESQSGARSQDGLPACLPATSEPWGLGQSGPRNVGLFTVQRFNQNDNPRELHYNHSPGKHQIMLINSRFSFCSFNISFPS